MKSGLMIEELLFFFKCQSGAYNANVIFEASNFTLLVLLSEFWRSMFSNQMRVKISFLSKRLFAFLAWEIPNVYWAINLNLI